MDWIIFFFAVALIIWLNSKQDQKRRRHALKSKNVRAEPKNESVQGVANPPKLISGRSYFSYGPSNSTTPSVLRRPSGECICGCNGIPLTLLPEYSIDYEAYKRCPARLRRKQSGLYTDDQGRVRSWKPGSTTRTWTTKRGPSKKELQKRKNLASQQKQKVENLYKRLENDAKKERRLAEEADRIANKLPARGAVEAERRGLETYIGKDCPMGHGGLRATRNGECVQCRRDNSRLRDAMRRGAYPRDLTNEEKRRISEIYAESKRRTKETGIQHHVDHIKPLSKGGEHHPDNLQILTAAQNLRKGASWEES